jgi:hypothetical protein
LFTLSKGAQAPLEPQRSPLPGTPITALAGASNYRFRSLSDLSLKDALQGDK